MIRPTLQMLTVCTVSAAVISALLLSASDDALPDSTHLLCANTMLRSDEPATPAALRSLEPASPSPVNAPAISPSRPEVRHKFATDSGHVG